MLKICATSSDYWCAYWWPSTVKPQGSEASSGSHMEKGAFRAILLHLHMQSLYTLKLRQNDCHIDENIFKCTFVIEIDCSPARRQAITWPNAEKVLWGIYAYTQWVNEQCLYSCVWFSIHILKEMAMLAEIKTPFIFIFVYHPHAKTLKAL